MRRKRIGVLELLLPGPPASAPGRFYASRYVRQYVSIMPQVVSVWCAQLNHSVHYDAYYGQADPLQLLPDDLDVLFISSYSKNSPLAYALAKLFRRRGCLTVIGGPHAKAFPDDCLRFFDIVVKECDRNLIADIVSGAHEPGSVLSASRPLNELPSVQERLPYILRTSLARAGRSRLSTVPMLASMGCPYTCDFCIDWNSTYRVLPTAQLSSDLEFLSRQYPGTVVTFHDPNFAVKFDHTMSLLESVPAERRNPYAMECSLSILKPRRLEKLRQTRCMYVLPGIESWGDYSEKAGSGARTGKDKLADVVERLNTLLEYVDGIQANLIFGTDSDIGTEPVQLTREFIHKLPAVWPAINVPIPYGGTPLTANLVRAGRVHQTLPFLFYRNPYLIFQPAHYSAAEYYRHWIELRSTLLSPALLLKRLRSNSSWRVRGMNVLRTGVLRSGLTEAREQAALLAQDRQFAAYHAGASAVLPRWYHAKYEQVLGRYSEVLSMDERIPVHHQARTNSAATA